MKSSSISKKLVTLLSIVIYVLHFIALNLLLARSIRLPIAKTEFIPFLYTLIKFNPLLNFPPSPLTLPHNFFYQSFKGFYSVVKYFNGAFSPHFFRKVKTPSETFVTYVSNYFQNKYRQNVGGKGNFQRKMKIFNPWSTISFTFAQKSTRCSPDVAYG